MQSRGSVAQTVLMILPIAVFATLIFCCVVDIPYWDDYDAVLGTLINFSSASSIPDKIKTVIALHNEHRLGVLGIFSVLSWSLLGRVNFEVLSICGNFGLVVLLLALWMLAKDKLENTTRNILMISCAFLILQPQFYDTPLWPTVSLSNFPVVYFAALTFLLLEKTTWWRFAGALATGTLGMFSQGNGILILPLAFLYLLLRKEFSKGFICGVVTATLVALYFQGFPTGSGSAASFDLLRALDRGLTFLGAAPAFRLHKIAFVIGLVEVLAFLWLTKRKFYSKAPGIYLFLVFLLLSVAISCIGRPDQDAAYVLAQPRYKFLSIVIFATTIVAVTGMLEKIGRSADAIYFAKASLAASILFWLGAYASSADNVIEIRDILLRSSVKWNLTRDGLYYPVPSAAQGILEKSEKLGIYELSAAQMAPLVFNCAVASSNPTPSEGVQFSIDTFLETPQYLYFEGWILPPDNRSLFQSVTLKLVGKDHNYDCKTRTIIRPDVRNALKSVLALRSGFAVVIPTNGIAADTYTVNLGVSSSGKDWIINTGKTINTSALTSAKAGI